MDKEAKKRVAIVTGALLGKDGLPCATCMYGHPGRSRPFDGDLECTAPGYERFASAFDGNGGTKLDIPATRWRSRTGDMRYPWLRCDNIFKHACGGKWYEPKDESGEA